MDMREIIASLVREMKVWTEKRIDEKLDERLGGEDKSCYELWWGDEKNEKPTAEYAWRVYDFINDWKNGCFGAITLTEAIDKHFK